MKLNRSRSVGFVLTSLLLTIGLSGCTSSSQSKQDQNAQDEKTREQVAKATEEAKQKSKEAAQKLDEASRKLEHKAAVAAEGVKEGWNRDQKQPLDLNSATETDLLSLPGTNRETAQKIIDGRPYKSEKELMTRHIVSADEYRSISSYLTVK
jgi:DNA uptake protein ComE-like DNA-binding protein